MLRSDPYLQQRFWSQIRILICHGNEIESESSPDRDLDPASAQRYTKSRSWKGRQALSLLSVCESIPQSGYKSRLNPVADPDLNLLDPDMAQLNSAPLSPRRYCWASTEVQKTTAWPKKCQNRALNRKLNRQNLGFHCGGPCLCITFYTFNMQQMQLWPVELTCYGLKLILIMWMTQILNTFWYIHYIISKETFVSPN